MLLFICLFSGPIWGGPFLCWLMFCFICQLQRRMRKLWWAVLRMQGYLGDLHIPTPAPWQAMKPYQRDLEPLRVKTSLNTLFSVLSAKNECVYTYMCVCTQCVEGVCMCVHRCTCLHISISLPLSLSESPFCCLKSLDQKLSSCVFFVWYSCLQGAWMAQWLECQLEIHDRKVPGSCPGWSGGRIFFSRVNFLCWLLFWHPSHCCVNTVAPKTSQSFCQKCRWQVIAKHTWTLPMWLWPKWHCKLVHRTCTKMAAVWNQVAASNNTISTPFQWIFKKRAV